MPKTHKVVSISKPPIKSVNPDKHEITIEAEQLQWIGKVRTFDGDIQSFKSRIKTLNEEVVEILEGTDEYSAVVELAEKLAAAREDLKRKLSSNSRYTELTEELAEEKLALKDATDNMSDFLLGYFAETHERQIELGPKDARDVVLKGSLGKRQKRFQTNIFSKPPVNTNEGRKDLE